MFKVGDHARVKLWETIVEEMNGQDEPPHPMFFNITKSIIGPHCGKAFTITGVNNGCYSGLVLGLGISEVFIEPVTQHNFKN